MPNDKVSIVTAILQADTANAEKGLKRTGDQAIETSKDFDHLAHSSKKMDQSLKATGRQAVKTTGSMRQLRRAGRDLDGALMDLGQGLSLVNPAMGNLIMNLSDAASIAEGVGRIGTLLLNPMFLGMAGLVTTLGFAFVAFNAEQEAAKKRAEDLQKQVEETNKAFDEQSKFLSKVNEKLGGYVSELNNARADLSLLTGAISAFELAQDQATQKTEEFRQTAKKQNEEAITLAEKNAEQIQKTIIELDKQLTIEKEIANKYISKVQLAAGVTGELSTQGKKIEAELNNAREQRKITIERLQFLKANNKEIDRTADQLEATRQKQIEINEQNRINAENKKKFNDAEQKRQKEIAEQEKSRLETAKKVNADLKTVQDARNKLSLIQTNLTKDTLTEEQKIENSYQKQLEEIRSLAIVGEDLKKGAELENLALENKNRLLDDLNNKQKTQLDLIKEQGKEAQNMIRLIGASINAIQSPQAFVSGVGNILGGVGDLGGFAGLSAAAPAVSAAGSAISGVAGLGGSVQAEIERAELEGLTLNEAQAEKVVLGNMQKAFNQFLTDLERGLELLPKIMIDILPEFIASLVKVINVDLLRVLTLELPLALVRAMPEIAIAFVNELGFLFADLVTSISMFFDDLRSFLSGDFTRRTKQERTEDRKDWIEETFSGVVAAINSIKEFAGGGKFLPHAAGGMRFTGSSRQGLAMLHQNEFVVPASGQRPQSVDRQMSSMGGGINITVNGTIVEQNAIDALVRKIEERFNSNYGLASSNLFGGR